MPSTTTTWPPPAQSKYPTCRKPTPVANCAPPPAYPEASVSREAAPAASRDWPQACHAGRNGARHSLPLACRQSACQILNHMVQYTAARLNASLAALSAATRRGVLEQLGRADASISDLAEKFNMTLTGMKKHVGVLQQSGLVTTQKVGRLRTCKLGLRVLEEAAACIERYRQLWEARFNELDKIVEELKRKD